MNRVLQLFAVIIFISVLIAGFLAYFVRPDPAIDGLGRELELAPTIVRFFLLRDSLWAGWSWYALDMIWFFGGICLAGALFLLSIKED